MFPRGTRETNLKEGQIGRFRIDSSSEISYIKITASPMWDTSRPITADLWYKYIPVKTPIIKEIKLYNIE